jgi:hypothetical protein
MPSAQQSFVLLWKRVVAALSLVAAALLAPTAPAPVGAGVVGSRMGNGPAVASAANALTANVDALVEGGEQRFPLDSPEANGAHATPCVLTAWHEFPVPLPAAVAPAGESRVPLPAFASRAGQTRAPPSTSQFRI